MGLTCIPRRSDRGRIFRKTFGVLRNCIGEKGRFALGVGEFFFARALNHFQLTTNGVSRKATANPKGTRPITISSPPASTYHALSITNFQQGVACDEPNDSYKSAFPDMPVSDGHGATFLTGSTATLVVGPRHGRPKDVTARTGELHLLRQIHRT